MLRYRASALYHNDGNGRFTDVTAKAKLPDYPYLAKSVAFVDYDHDGDLGHPHRRRQRYRRRH